MPDIDHIWKKTTILLPRIITNPANSKQYYYVKPRSLGGAHLIWLPCTPTIPPLYLYMYQASFDAPNQPPWKTHGKKCTARSTSCLMHHPLTWENTFSLAEKQEDNRFGDVRQSICLCPVGITHEQLTFNSSKKHGLDYDHIIIMEQHKETIKGCLWSLNGYQKEYQVYKFSKISLFKFRYTTNSVNSC